MVRVQRNFTAELIYERGAHRNQLFGSISSVSGIVAIFQFTTSTISFPLRNVRSTHTVNVNGPNGPVVPDIGAKTLAVVREPNVNELVLGHGEQQVALAVILDLSQGTGLTLQKDRFLAN